MTVKSSAKSNKIVSGKRNKEMCEVTKKRLKNKEHLDKNQHNLQMMMKYSNATPIQNYGHIGYKCCFCEDQFPKAADLKTHTLEEHDDIDKAKFMKGVKINYYVVKLDITLLQCKICNISIDSMERLVDHLVDDHEKLLYKDFKCLIIPFKLVNESRICFVCSKFCHSFKSLFVHLQRHFHNYICETCGASFINFSTMSNHLRTHKKGTFKCDFCPKIFDTILKKRLHQKTVHVKTTHKCGYCNEKFNGDSQKQMHLAQVHGVCITVKCPRCDNVYNSRASMMIHLKKTHYNERRHECMECVMKFFSVTDLRNHMVVHTGVKKYRCGICLKAFGRKSSLREHIRIHTNDKRFKCEKCGQGFVQKYSWKNHMHSKHGLVVT